MDFPRASGILLHPTSLPSQFGIGDFGPEAYAFADFLSRSGQSFWQMLPLGPPDHGGSPYASFSAFAGNTLLISPEQLIADGLLDTSDLPEAAPLTTERVEFDYVRKFKQDLLSKAFDKHQQGNNPELRASFESFVKVAHSWLDDFALFSALRDANGGSAWSDWDGGLKYRQTEALTRSRAILRNEIEAHKFYQFLFFRQWFKLKAYCNQHGIGIIGDVPIFVAHDSTDVWTNPEQFKLDENGMPKVVAGVPPDYFSPSGQLWGHPLFCWERMRRDGFNWWKTRISAAFDVFDVVRLDHFRGFAACWEIPASDTSAHRGRWVPSPGKELFTALRDALGELPIIAEDLGVITPDVDELRLEFGFPGMRILQFGFKTDEKNIHLPRNFSRHIVAYTATHDSDTSVGWFTNGASDYEKVKCLPYLQSDGKEIHWDFIKALSSSLADVAIIPLQDLLGLGSEARMNVPNSAQGNWSWRYKRHDLTDEISWRLKHQTAMCGR